SVNGKAGMDQTETSAQPAAEPTGERTESRAADEDGRQRGAGAAGARTAASRSRLSSDSVTLAYDQRTIADELSVAIPDESFTVVVGPNACGKSTLLRALSRMLK